MQAIKQNYGKQCNASDMQRKTKAGAENGAKCRRQAKKNKAGTQNDAKCKRKQGGHAKQCKKASDMQIKQNSTQNEQNAKEYKIGTQNDARMQAICK